MKTEEYEKLSGTERVFAVLLMDIISELKNLNRLIDVEAKV